MRSCGMYLPHKTHNIREIIAENQIHLIRSKQQFTILHSTEMLIIVYWFSRNVHSIPKRLEFKFKLMHECRFKYWNHHIRYQENVCNQLECMFFFVSLIT